MPEFEVLGTDASVDPTEPVSAGKTLGYLAVGAMVFIMVLRVGQQGADAGLNWLSETIGTSVGGEDVLGTNGGGL